MSVKVSNNRGNFWGLVEQKGPWKTTMNDLTRSQQNQPSKQSGGGIQIGGTKNAGHAGWYAQMNPNVDANYGPPPPKPSQYVQKSIISRPLPMLKGARGSVLYNSPIESVRSEPDASQKPGSRQQPLFQESEVEAPRVTENPSLTQEIPSLMPESDYENSSIHSDHFQSWLNGQPNDQDILTRASDPTTIIQGQDQTTQTELHQGSKGNQTDPLTVEQSGNQTDPPDMSEAGSDPFRDPSEVGANPFRDPSEVGANAFRDPSEVGSFRDSSVTSGSNMPTSHPSSDTSGSSMNTASMDAPQLALQAILTRALLEYQTDRARAVEETRQLLLDNPMLAASLGSQMEFDEGETLMGPIDDNLYNEFQSFIRDLRLRYRGVPLDRSRRKTKLFQPFVDPERVTDFKNFTKNKRNNRKEKKVPRQIAQPTENAPRVPTPAPVESDRARGKRPRMEELTEGVSLPNQIKELEKRIEAYKTIEKRKKLTNNQLKAWLAARSKLRELRKKRDEKKD